MSGDASMPGRIYMAAKQNTFKLLSIIAILAVIFSNLQPTQASAQDGDGLTRQVNAESGRVSFISSDGGKPLSAPQALGTSIQPQDPAMALAKRFAPEFGVKDPERDLAEMKKEPGENGRLTVRYQQMHQGIPVMGGELIVNTNENGDLNSLNGEVSPDLLLQTQPAITAAQAKETAVQSLAKWYEKTPEDFTATEPELWIFDESLLQPSTRPVELVWRMEVTPRDANLPLRELVLVNAERGSISLHFNQVDTAWRSAEQAGTTSGPPSQPTQTPFLIETPAPMVTPLPPIDDPYSRPKTVSQEQLQDQAGELAGASWYVSTTGNDASSCSSAGSPCKTINGAIAKAAESGDTIKVAIGTYTGSGTEVVIISKSITLSGGWDASFTTQTGMSTIDGQTTRRGITLSTGTVVVDRFIVQNGYHDNQGGGIINTDTLTLNNSIVSNNVSDWMGGGIISFGTMTLNNTLVSANIGGTSGSGGGGGGGIQNYSGTLTLNNSTVSQNTLVGGFSGSGIYTSGTVILNNSTVSNNSGGHGEGIYSFVGTIILNNSTISGNQSYGFENMHGTVTLQNTIIAGNGTAGDCYNYNSGYSGTIISQGYNIIGNPQGCTFTPTTGDMVNIDPKLGLLIGFPGYIPLLSGSPAIDAGNSATPGSGDSACLSTDVRGVARPVGARCDIGAYEYTLPGGVASLYILGGNNQRTGPELPFAYPLSVAALDSVGSPVSGVSITFTAPSSGASVMFTDTGTGTTSAITNANAIAHSSTFTANAILGTYTVTASASGTGTVNYNLQNLAWYVSSTGNDENSCTSVGLTCATINGAIGKAIPGDAIFVAAGTYTDSGTEVLHINKSITLSGGWDPTFTTQNGASTIDGQNARGGIRKSCVAASLDRFIVMNAATYGGIESCGDLTITNSSIQNNSAPSFDGGGIRSLSGKLILNNVTVSGNTTSSYYGGGIYIYRGTLLMNNTTVTSNTALSAGGVYVTPYTGASASLKNSIVAGNSYQDCEGPISSAGYNLIGNNNGCTFLRVASDIVGTPAGPINPRLAPLQNYGGATYTHALIEGSPAIDAGNPAVPGSGGDACLPADQRSVVRPMGATCDIGAYEGSLPWIPLPLASTYTANLSPSLPGTFLCNETQQPCTYNDANPHANAAHKYAIGTYNFYSTKHLRNSIDNGGMVITSTVNYCPIFYCPYPNAFWNGEQIVYGSAYDYPLADDVVAHELTHGVTQYESNLFYYYQSGAINESFSDLWGEYYDQTNGQGTDTFGVKWQIGEDVSGLGAMRSMSNPPLFGDPDRITSSLYEKKPYYDPYWDNGGVHTNSGVNNKAVFLMVDGGTFNGRTVTALGWDKVGAIYYEVQTNLLASGADYSDLYYALQQACTNLIGQKGISADDCTEVRDAVDAVEMNKQPVANYNTDAPLCTTSSPVIAFADDLENGKANWTFSNGSQVRWQYDSPWGGYAQSGQHFLYADDYPQYQGSVTDARAVLKSFVVPNNAFLHFAQAYEFEYDSSGNYDGGVLEYSTNGGLSWADAGSLMEYNGYRGKIFSTYINPLKGRSAFVGSSHGYISTRLNLTSLAGKTVNFRWRMGLDDYGVAVGWWVDNIKVYTCGSAATFADVPASHPYAHDIEILYANGLTAGCVTTPLKFCPDQIMDRVQSAVFMLRGSLGVGYTPPAVATHMFADNWAAGPWAEKWAEGMFNEGMTAGCTTSGPLKFCPWDLNPREQAVIFGLRLKYGNNYQPPPATGTLFADMTDTGYYATKWAEQAYKDGLIPSCGMSGGKPKFCPKDLVTRGLGAYIIVRAKGLSMP